MSEVPPATAPASQGTSSETKTQEQVSDLGLLGSGPVQAENQPTKETPKPVSPAPGTPVEVAKEEEAIRVAKEKELADAQAATLKAKADEEAQAKAKQEAEKTAEAEAAKKKAEEAEAMKPTLEKLKVPENTLISKERQAEIVAQAKDKDEAQKTLEAEHNVASRIQTEGLQRLKSQGDKWRTEIQSDPELGGQNFKETDRLYTKAVEEVFGKEMIADLKALGVEAHPKFVKGMVKVAKGMEAKPLVHGDRPEAKAKPKTPAQIAYGYDETQPYDANKAAVNTAASISPRGMS
jgi:hypothetical protein